MLGIRTTFRKSSSELLELIGMIYMRGLLEQAYQSTNAIFHEIFGNPVFSANMSRNRFKFLIAHISLDDHITRPTPRQHNRFAAFREIFEELNKNCGKFLVPNDYLSLDDTLYPTRTQISFKQFNPSKPSKYGMLYKSINACSYPFQPLCILLSQKQSRHLTILLGCHKQ